jgi:hypothetical protein
MVSTQSKFWQADTTAADLSALHIFLPCFFPCQKALLGTGASCL